MCYYDKLPDGIACPHSNPLRNGAILLQLFGQFGLYTESLMRRLEMLDMILSLSIYFFTKMSSYCNLIGRNKELKWGAYHGWSSQLDVQPEKEEGTFKNK